MDRGQEIEMARERKRTLYSRMQEAKRLAADTVDPGERRRQTERARILRDMYRDVCEELARLEGRPRAEKRDVVHGDFIFSDGKGGVWKDIEGTSWNQIDGAAWGDILSARAPGAATGRQAALLTDLLNDAVGSCTDRQKTLIHEYYTLEKTMEQIGREQKIGRSSVSRTIKAGLAHVGHHVTARLTIAACIDSGGRFDYLKFCRNSALLTERQTELMYLALTQDASYTMMAAYIGRCRSTVSRSMERMERRLRAVRVELLPEVDVSGIRFKDWAGLSEETLCAKLGLPHKFYYTAIRRGEKIDGIPLLHYHILCRMRRDGRSDRETAAETGVSAALCRRVNRDYPGAAGLDMGLLPAYRPEKIRRDVRPGLVLASLRDLTRAGDGIIDRIDAPTLERIRRAAHAGT